jgi:hypothetical protein
MQLEAFAYNFERQVTASMLVRAERAMEHLLGAIQEGYYEVMAGSRGGAGSVGALHTSLRQAENAILGVIAFGKQGDYLKFTEYGVKPSGRFAAYSTIPPVKAFAQWIVRARLRVPDTYASLSEKTKRRATALKRLESSGGAAAKRYARLALAHNTQRGKRARARDNATGDLQSRAILRWAWAMAIKRKRVGYKGLRVIERIMRQEEANIRALLSGA